MTTKLNVYREAARLLGDSRLAALTDDTSQRHSFDDAWDRTVEYVLRAAYWSFALKTVAPAASLVSPVPGFTYVWDLPCDWIRTHAIFVLESVRSRECPIDCRHQLEEIHTRATPIWLRYISNDMADPELWPEHFANAVAARLAFECAERITGNPAKAEQMFQLWDEKFQRAVPIDAIPDDPWLIPQLSGAFRHASELMLMAGNWRFALVSADMVDGFGAQLLSNGSFDSTTGWTSGAGWSIHSGYGSKVSSGAVDVDLSRTPSATLVAGASYRVEFTVSGYSAGSVTPVFTGGTPVLGTARTANGTYTETLVAVTGNTTFALRATATSVLKVDSVVLRQVTATLLPAPGFTAAYPKPADWLRTQSVFLRSTVRECPLDVREHGDRWSANVAPTVRYVSNAYLDSTLWHDDFHRLVAAYLGIQWGDVGLQVTENGASKIQVPWPDYLSATLAREAIPESPWLAKQFDGSFERSARYVLEQGAWKFATKTASLTAEGSPAPQSGFTNSFAKPADWLRAHAIFVTTAAAREAPLDVRDSETKLSANVTPIIVRYISTTSGLNSVLWTEDYTRVVAAHLGIDSGDHGTEPREDAKALLLWPRYLEAALAKEALAPDLWLPHQLDGTFRASSRYLLEAGNWRFGLKSALLVAEVSPAPLPGFSASYAKPADWLRTQALFDRDGSRELPIDSREHGTRWSANVAPTVRYVSTDGLVSSLWPDDFLRVVAAHLGLSWGDGGVVSDQSGQAQQSLMWPRYLDAALQREAIAESPWLRHQFNGSMQKGARWLLDQANWRFAVKTVELAADRDLELLANTDFDTDASWTKGTGWTIHSGTANKAAGTGSDLSQAEALTAGLVYAITYTVSGYVAGTVTAMFTGGTDVTGTARSANGTYTESLTAVTGNVTVLLRASATGNFKIDNVSLKQVTAGLAPSVGYDYAFTKPADFGRTFHLFRRWGTAWYDVDFRDEDSRLHANYAPIVLRYVSTAGETSTTWSDAFERALLTYLEFEEAKHVPDMSGAQLQARSMAWTEAFRNARLKDDMQERPRFNDSGRLVAARRGASSRFGIREQNGWY